MNKSLDYRRDNRSVKQFTKDIQHRTAKEKFLIRIFARELIKQKHIVEVSNYGIDNSGKLVKRSSCKPDYKVILDEKEYLVEVKNSPVSYKWTFKQYHLQQYVKYNAWILLFWGTDYIDKNPRKINIENTRWSLISPEKIKLMLDSYSSFRHPAFGDKFCIEIPQEDFGKFIDKAQKITVEVK